MNSVITGLLALSLLGTPLGMRTQPGHFTFVNLGQGRGMGSLGQAVNDIHFLNYRTGVFIGYDGAFRTEDGGLTWRKLALGEVVSDDGKSRGSNWYGIRMTSEQDLWALGQIHPGGLGRSCLRHSPDGGQTWEEVLHGQISGAIAMEVLGLNEIYAMCHDRAFVSRDGGQSWERVNLGLSGWHGLRDVWAVTPDLYYAVADLEHLRGAGAILRSTDGGHTWQRLLADQTLPYLRYIQLPSPGEGWAAGGALLHTTDGGESWAEVPTPLKEGQGISGIQFFQDGRGWISASIRWAGSVPLDQYSVLYTYDRGQHWVPVAGGWKSIHTMCWLDPEHGWVGGRVPGFVPATIIGMYNWR